MLLLEEKKHKIPDELLGGRYKGGTYWITMTGKVYGAMGHQLKVTDSEHGLNHPKKLGRNVWWIRAMMFVPNPNGYKHVVKVDEQIHWVSEEVYARMIKAWTGKTYRARVSPEDRALMKLAYKLGNSVTWIAENFNVSRMSVYRFIK